jgi:hypothetical protein
MSSEKAKAASKRWRERHPEAVKATNKRARDRRGKAIHAADMKQWRKNNPRAAKNADLKKRFGITIDDYDKMFAAQSGVCAACHGKPGQRALAVDHCHEPGLVRGLLCHPCNTALGLLRECPNRMNALKDYIGRFNWLDIS